MGRALSFNVENILGLSQGERIIVEGQTNLVGQWMTTVRRKMPDAKFVVHKALVVDPLEMTTVQVSIIERMV